MQKTNIAVGVTLFVFGILFSGAACAEDFSPAKRIKQLNEQNAILQAEKANADLEAQIAERRAATAKAKSEQSTSDQPKSMAQTFNNTDELPTVKAIEGVDGKLYATLLTSRGQQVVKTNDRLAGGWAVKQIDSHVVVLAKDRDLVRLSFGAESSSVGSQSFSPPSGFPTVPSNKGLQQLK